MALPVIAVIALSAAAGAFILNKVQKDAQKDAAEQQARHNALSLAATEFEQGKTYAVQLMVTPDIGTKDPVTASKVIQSTMEQLGWKVLSTPVTRGPSDASAFITGQPSQWVFSGQWTKTDKFMNVVPAWLGSAMAFKLPVA